MELKDFVSQTLVEIVEGVRDAQGKTEGCSSKTSYVAPAEVGNKLVQTVSFDVAVTTVDSTSTKGGIGVFVGPVALGSQGKSDAQNSSLSRIKFEVPLRFPMALNPGN